jgi:hypothetical protein
VIKSPSERVISRLFFRVVVKSSKVDSEDKTRQKINGEASQDEGQRIRNADKCGGVVCSFPFW